MPHLSDVIAAITVMRDEWAALRDEEYNPKRADQSAGWFRADGYVKAYDSALALLRDRP